MVSPKKAIGLSLPIRLGRDGYFATNTDTISQISDNIKNLILTRPGERRFNNAFGSNLYNLLFQSVDFDVTKDILVDSVQRDIDKIMNGVVITDVQLPPKQQLENNNNMIYIHIVFRYNNTDGSVDVNINNNRI